VRNCDDPNPKMRHHFEQPVLQTAQMFVGEAGCWIVVGLMALYRKMANKTTPDENGYRPIRTTDDLEADAEAAAADGTNDSEVTLTNNNNGTPKPSPADDALAGARVVLLALPAICDILATTLMNAGLLMVAASIYQMTRGALVLFVGLFSVLFLRRTLHLYQWLSLVGVVTGVALVGLAGVIDPDTRAKAASSVTGLVTAAMDDDESAAALAAILGVVLIAGAQIFTATQFVLEEWILERSAIDPINVVGWEGLFGLAVTLIIMLVLHFAIGRTDAGRLGMFDMVEGLRQMTEHRAVLISSLLIMVSIGYVFGSSTLMAPLLIVHTAASISSVCPSRGTSVPPRVPQSTPAELCSSGLFPSVWAGSRSSGSRLWVLLCWSTSPLSSTTLWRRPSSS
jgi:drug/metabolite transporter (DMT)-like permease